MTLRALGCSRRLTWVHAEQDKSNESIFKPISEMGRGHWDWKQRCLQSGRSLYVHTRSSGGTMNVLSMLSWRGFLRDPSGVSYDTRAGVFE